MRTEKARSRTICASTASRAGVISPYCPIAPFWKPVVSCCAASASSWRRRRWLWEAARARPLQPVIELSVLHFAGRESDKIDGRDHGCEKENRNDENRHPVQWFARRFLHAAIMRGRVACSATHRIMSREAAKRRNSIPLQAHIG
ncbi:hypothetical protein D3C78_1419840 [compost metagenome]